MNWFDVCSSDYVNVRPEYPDELFRWIERVSVNHNFILDCGTGNGQAAYKLADFFKKVLAVDVSQNQLINAKKHPKIEYKCGSVESIDLPGSSVDVVVSASAVHWFNLEEFYNKCKEILSPTGLIIVWTYTWPQSSNLSIDLKLDEIKKILLPFFPKQTLFHINEYKELPFPFEQISVPNIKMEVEWSLDMLLDFLSTWPSVNDYIKKVNNNFLNEIKSEFLEKWPEVKKVSFLFPLYIKAGNNEK